MSKPGKWKYRSYPSEEGERFAASHTWRGKKAGRVINFWHIKDGHEMLYSFLPNKKYNSKATWSEDLCRDLVEDLRSSQPSIKVLRYAMDGKLVFAEEWYKGKDLPKTLPAPKYSPGWSEHLRKQAMKQRIPIEERKTEPAPYFLFGKHRGYGKEYAWRLYPDVPERQGIEPGDLVFVQTGQGVKAVSAVRIEAAADREQPQCCVICKKESLIEDPVETETN